MWSGIPISFRTSHSLFVIHTVKGFGIVSKAEVDVFLELSCFFNDPADVGKLIWFLCLFYNQLEHLEVHSSRIS